MIQNMQSVILVKFHVRSEEMSHTAITIHGLLILQHSETEHEVFTQESGREQESLYAFTIGRHRPECCNMNYIQTDHI
jgi:hypothetical protein